jgi:FixJ family two-component response regulator
MTKDKFVVMIVDDDESVRRAARRLINHTGFLSRLSPPRMLFSPPTDFRKRHA